MVPKVDRASNLTRQAISVNLDGQSSFWTTSRGYHGFWYPLAATSPIVILLLFLEKVMVTQSRKSSHQGRNPSYGSAWLRTKGGAAVSEPESLLQSLAWASILAACVHGATVSCRTMFLTQQCEVRDLTLQTFPWPSVTCSRNFGNRRASEVHVHAPYR